MSVAIPNEFSLRTRDIEGARPKFIERQELMSRIRMDNNINNGHAQPNSPHQQNLKYQQLRNDFDSLKQQVNQLNSTLMNAPNSQFLQRMSPASNSSSVISRGSNQSRLTGNSENRINVYRNVGSEIVKNNSLLAQRNLSQGSIPTRQQAAGAIQNNSLNIPQSPKQQFESFPIDNRNRLNSQDHLPTRLSPPSPNENRLPNILPRNPSQQRQNSWDFNNQKSSPYLQQQQPQYQLGRQSPSTLNQQSYMQLQRSPTDSLNYGMFKSQVYERHRYVPLQKNEFSRFPSKQVLFM